MTDWDPDALEEQFWAEINEFAEKYGVTADYVINEFLIEGELINI